MENIDINGEFLIGSTADSQFGISCLCHPLINYHDEDIPKINNDDSSESLIQKGLLMQKLDNSLIEKINELRKLLSINNISLLDNLISICYDDYTNEELSALLGVERKKWIIKMALKI